MARANTVEELTQLLPEDIAVVQSSVSALVDAHVAGAAVR